MICSPLWREIDQRTLVILDIISKMVDDWLYMADVKQKRWTMGLSYSSRRVRILFNQALSAVNKTLSVQKISTALGCYVDPNKYPQSARLAP